MSRHAVGQLYYAGLVRRHAVVQLWQVVIPPCLLPLRARCHVAKYQLNICAMQRRLRQSHARARIHPCYAAIHDSIHARFMISWRCFFFSVALMFSSFSFSSLSDAFAERAPLSRHAAFHAAFARCCYMPRSPNACSMLSPRLPLPRSQPDASCCRCHDIIIRYMRLALMFRCCHVLLRRLSVTFLSIRFHIR